MADDSNDAGYLFIEGGLERLRKLASILRAQESRRGVTLAAFDIQPEDAAALDKAIRVLESLMPKGRR
jgi:hypothetical protein